MNASDTISTGKTTAYVISDLHLADGGALDDFHDDDLFARWLGSCDAATTVLILNGDWLAFEQIAPLAVPDGTPSSLLWTEAYSVEKMHNCMSAHGVFFDALAAFHAGGGEIRVTAGNHDIDFVWPGVQRVVAERINASGSDRFSVSAVGTSFANVWVQHGHQFDKTNSTKDAENFIHVGPDGQEYLERIWGTDFVLEFFNPLHEELRFAANVKPQWKMVLEGLKHRWLGWRHFVRVVAFIARSGIPVTALADVVLSDDQADAPDLAWLDSFFSDEETAMIIRNAIDELGPEVANELGLEGLDADLVAALRSEEPIDISLEDFSLPARGPDGAADPVLGLFRDRGEVRGARAKVEEGFDHVVLGHTHHMVDGEEIEPGRFLFNPGTWIPHIDLDDPAVAAEEAAKGMTKELLNDERFYATKVFAVEITVDAVPKVVSLETFRPE